MLGIGTLWKALDSKFCRDALRLSDQAFVKYNAKSGCLAAFFTYWIENQGPHSAAWWRNLPATRSKNSVTLSVLSFSMAFTTYFLYTDEVRSLKALCSSGSSLENTFDSRNWHRDTILLLW